MAKVKQEHKIVISTAIAIVIIWCGDAVYQSFISHKSSFLHVLTNVTGHEPVLRIALTLSFLVFGISVSRILAKRKAC